MYIEGPPPLYISYISPEQTKQYRHQQILELVGDKGRWIEKVTKMKKNKQWNDVFRRKLLSVKFWCIFLSSLTMWHTLGRTQCPLNLLKVFIMCDTCKMSYLTSRIPVSWWWLSQWLITWKCNILEGFLHKLHTFQNVKKISYSCDHCTTCVAFTTWKMRLSDQHEK